MYLAEHVKMGRKVALKVMDGSLVSDSDAVARFSREAANAARISHQNVAAIYDFGEADDGTIYLAMEYVEGVSVASLAARDALSPKRVASIVLQAAQALEAAHHLGMVHRDVKPDNIMITKDRAGEDVVKVVDFGIAKVSQDESKNVTRTGIIIGTPRYMSPEQLSGGRLDGRSDIYSLALVAFGMLTGDLPFEANSVHEVIAARLTGTPRTLREASPDTEWPDAVQRIMDKGLARSPSDRYQSAEEFGREFFDAVSRMGGLPGIVVGLAGSATTEITQESPTIKSIALRLASVGSSAAERSVRRRPLIVGGVIALFLAAAATLVLTRGDSATGPDTLVAALRISSWALIALGVVAAAAFLVMIGGMVVARPRARPAEDALAATSAIGAAADAIGAATTRTEHFSWASAHRAER